MAVSSDANGAEVGYWYRQDWEDDPKLIVWMVEQMLRTNVR